MGAVRGARGTTKHQIVHARTGFQKVATPIAFLMVLGHITMTCQTNGVVTVSQIQPMGEDDKRERIDQGALKKGATAPMVAQMVVVHLELSIDEVVAKKQRRLKNTRERMTRCTEERRIVVTHTEELIGKYRRR